MSKFYRDYVWKEGIPYGLAEISAEEAEWCYKLPMDPYRKRISIEKFAHGHFVATLYDSALFDFRHLKPAEQYAWQKVLVHEGDETSVAQIYNQDDRLICVEYYSFQDGVCLSCRTVSAHGILLSNQKIHYKSLEALFDGVILYDSNEHPVLYKSYGVDENSGEFTELLEEIWDGATIGRLLSTTF